MWFGRSGSRKGGKEQSTDGAIPSPTKPLLEPQGYVSRSRESSPRKAIASTANSTPARMEFPRSLTMPTNTPYDFVFTEAPARLSVSSTGHGGRGALSPGGLLQPPTTARSQKNPSTVNLVEEELEGTDRLFDPFTGRPIAVLNAFRQDPLASIPQGDTLGMFGEGQVDDATASGGKHRSSGDLEDPVRQKIWDYLARIRSLQAEVAAMHLTMDGHGLGDPWGTTTRGTGAGGVSGVRSRSGSMNVKEGVKTVFSGDSSTRITATPEAMPKMRIGGDSDSDEEMREKRKEKRKEEFGELDMMFERKQESLKSVMVKLKELSSAVRMYHELENPTITSPRQDTWEPRPTVLVASPPGIEFPSYSHPAQDTLKPLNTTNKSIPRLTLAPILTSSPASSLPPSPLPPPGSRTPLSPMKTPSSARRVSLEMGAGGGRHSYIPTSPRNGPPPLPTVSIPHNR